MSHSYLRKQSDFLKITGAPFTYWASKSIFDAFAERNVGSYFIVRNGISTGDNNRYLRLWFEISNQSAAWVPCNKGGEFRKWYGNNEYVVFWENNGYQIKNALDEKGRIKARLGGVEHSFQRGVEMSRITSGSIGFRYCPGGFVYESSTNDIFEEAKSPNLYYLLGFLNTKVADEIIGLINPTINVMPEDVRKVPLLMSDEKQKVIDLASANISLSKQDWDSFETSWEFTKHPLV